MNSNNVFQQVRLDYNEKIKGNKKGEKLTQEKVAELTNSSLSTIKRIETGEAIPQSDLVLKLSEMYNSPKLIRFYCGNCCALGTHFNRDEDFGFQPTSLFEAGYGLINANKQLDAFKNELFDILSDGVVTLEEIERLQDILTNLDKVQQIVSVIKDMINEQVDIK